MRVMGWERRCGEELGYGLSAQGIRGVDPWSMLLSGRTKLGGDGYEMEVVVCVSVVGDMTVSRVGG